MNPKNSNAVMIAVICAVIVIIFAVAVVMFAKGRSDGGEQKGSLTETYMGSWVLPGDSHVLQSPRTTDISEDDAIADENDFGVTITDAVYSTHRVGTVTDPFYKVERDCGIDSLDEQGMQSSGIMDEFSENASITRIDVYDAEGGNLCDTVFILDDEYLLYYGTGNYVFCAVKLDAVG